MKRSKWYHIDEVELGTEVFAYSNGNMPFAGRVSTYEFDRTRNVILNERFGRWLRPDDRMVYALPIRRNKKKMDV